VGSRCKQERRVAYRGASERDVIGVSAAFTYQNTSTRPHPVRGVVCYLLLRLSGISDVNILRRMREIGR
jgi:hypothetical protein